MMRINKSAVLPKLELHRSNVVDMPTMKNFLEQQHLQEYDRKFWQEIESRCIQLGVVFVAERVILLKDQQDNELYYYQADSGSLKPLVAFSPIKISYTDTDEPFPSVRMRIEQKEMYPDIFKPRPHVPG